MMRTRSNRLTRRQVYILAALFIAVVLVFALAAYLDMQTQVNANVSDFTTTLEAIDRNAKATITAIYSR